MGFERILSEIFARTFWEFHWRHTENTTRLLFLWYNFFTGFLIHDGMDGLDDNGYSHHFMLGHWELKGEFHIQRQ